MDAPRLLWHLKSLAAKMFVHMLVQANILDIMKKSTSLAPCMGNTMVIDPYQ